jgi:DNA-binding MarR family transcriptional regulator
MERPLLSLLPMNPVIFGSKQFYLGTLRFTRELLTPFGITPARFNMLIAITNANRAPDPQRDPDRSVRPGLAQRELRTILGVSGPTISRMLRSLEILGFVVRTPHPWKRRQKWVAVTAAALHRVHAAIEDAVDTRFLHWATEEFLNPEPGNHPLGDAAITLTRTILDRARDRLSDVATLWFGYDL